MYLVVALTGQGHTRAQETTATNQLVNVLDFFGLVRSTAVLTWGMACGLTPWWTSAVHVPGHVWRCLSRGCGADWDRAGSA